MLVPPFQEKYRIPESCQYYKNNLAEISLKGLIVWLLDIYILPFIFKAQHAFSTSEIIQRVECVSSSVAQSNAMQLGQGITVFPFWWIWLSTQFSLLDKYRDWLGIENPVYEWEEKYSLRPYPAVLLQPLEDFILNKGVRREKNILNLLP